MRNPSSSNAPIVAERPESFFSTIRASELLTYREKFNFPEALSLKKPERSDRANSPPEGYIAIYHRALVLGLRFPLLYLLVEILDNFNIPLGQLHPNSTIFILGFYHLCWMAQVVPTIFLFRCFFSLRVLSGKGKRWFCFWPGKVRLPLTSDPSSPPHCNRFLFAKGAGIVSRAWRPIPTGKLDAWTSSDAERMKEPAIARAIEALVRLPTVPFSILRDSDRIAAIHQSTRGTNIIFSLWS